MERIAGQNCRKKIEFILRLLNRFIAFHFSPSSDGSYKSYTKSVVSIVHPVSSSTLESCLLSSVMVNYKASRTSVELISATTASYRRLKQTARNRLDDETHVSMQQQARKQTTPITKPK